NINDDLLKQAARLSGITEKTAVVHAGLEALVARESAKRLAALGGSEPRLRNIRRRRPQACRWCWVIFRSGWSICAMASSGSSRFFIAPKFSAILLLSANCPVVP